MLMRRLATVTLIAVVAFSAFAVGAHADSVYGYTAAGTWFSPGQGYGSAYDNTCGRWTENNFSKGSGSWGLVTFIDPGGNWSNTRQGNGWILSKPSNVLSTKKLHCKNNSSKTYQGGCYGFSRAFPCA
jgi:hypothetical protein